jgi:peroxiredoxin
MNPASFRLLSVKIILPVCLLLLAGCEKKHASAPTAKGSHRPSAGDTNLVESRYDWNLKTLLEPYKTAGFSGRAWDESAERALVAFASLRSGLAVGTPWVEMIATNCEQAVRAGCQDPMIKYLHIRFSWDQTNTAKAYADALCQAALDMKPTRYPAIRKFYANRLAVQQYYDAYDKNADRQLIQQVGGTAYYLPEILNDPTIPIAEAYEACDAILQAYAGTKNLADYEAIYRIMQQPVFDKWPDDYRTFLIKGVAHTKMAWICRGNGYANTVTKEGWNGFENNLQIANQALSRAWELNPNDISIPLKMMKVELGQGQGREQMEPWFKRAMALDTNCFEACSSKLYYLEPKWHGSEADMLAFGWQCLQSTNWGGRVPLILLDAHEAIRRYREGDAKTNYWKQPEVWLDIQAAFDRFFQLNPDATNWYHNYAYYAYLCERWDKFNELLPKLGPVNYNYFGGRPEFAKMVSLAKTRAADTRPIQLTPAVETSRLMVKIQARANEGRLTESDLVEEFRQMDALVEKSREKSGEDAAQISFLKAMLYVQLLNNPEKGKELIRRVKRDFPGTEPARQADKIIAVVDQRAEKLKIRDALTVGKPFPGFEEQDLAGKPLSPADYKGKVLLIDFWATWCAPCVAELPDVRKTYEKYHAQGFEIIGISLDEDQAKMTAFIERQKMPWRQYFDGAGWENKLAVKYGVDSIPATYLLDRAGNIVAKDLRGDALEEAVAKALTK